MSREMEFTIYCLERYRFYKGLSGAEAADMFDRYDIYGYLSRYFPALHTMGDRAVADEIDAYISSTDNTDDGGKHSGQL